LNEAPALLDGAAIAAVAVRQRMPDGAAGFDYLVIGF
jgi:hypothetical protein